MGSTASKGKQYQDTSQYGEVYLQTDKTAYQAGDTVTGTIYINLISNYPGNQLFLKLKGKEVVHDVTKKRGKDYKMTVKCFGCDSTIKETVLVHSWEILSPGQFSFPFSFLLPHDLPASFYQQGRDYFAYIQYKLEAFIQPHNNSNPKLKYKQPLTLHEIATPKPDELSKEVRQKLEVCCNPEKGFATLKVSFEKNCYYPGDTARAIIEFDATDAKLTTTKIVLALKQKVILKAEGLYFSTELVKTTKELPGIKKGSKMGTQTLDIVLPRFANDSDFDRALDKAKITQSLLEGLKDKNDIITSSTRGKLIYSQFFLEVSCPMEGCCALFPGVSCDIGILSPEFELPVVSPPPGWQPIAEKPIHLVFPRVQKTQKPSMPSNPGQYKRMKEQFMLEYNLPRKVEMGSIHNTQADGDEGKVNQADSNAQAKINYFQKV